MRAWPSGGIALAVLGSLAAPLEAAVEVRHRRLLVPERLVAGTALAPAGGPRADLASLGVPPEAAFYDPHARRWASLLLREPLLPGDGVDNALSWAGFGVAGEPTEAQLEAAAWSALRGYLRRASALRIDLDELARPTVTVHDRGRLVQVHASRTLGGVPVRDSALVAVINSGNLVLLGLDHWADAVPARPALGADDARRLVVAHEPAFASSALPQLSYVPFAHEAAEGYGWRLVWVLDGRIPGDLGTWEALVDAVSGELLAFVDRNLHAKPARLFGGVYPLSNDGLPPDGVEQPGYPMPFADLRLPDGSTGFTNSSGVGACMPPPGPGPAGRRLIRTSLAGRYVTIADTCGLVRERWMADSDQAGDLGFGPGTDCAVPPGHSAGDTHAARTAFYELNRITEQARAYLPANLWLQSPVVANVNLPQSCGAFWSGTTLNYFRNGSGCRNVGEIAGVLDHEWGHGMDDNGADPTISNPAEAIADIHAVLRQNESCLGRGFFQQGGHCTGYGDPCTVCTGVRDLDWALHQSGLPHHIAWVQSRCPMGQGVCGREVHCAALIVAEAVWDLHARDLPAHYGLDEHSTLEIATRLAYLGGGLVSTWYQCTPPNGGCSALGGYLNFLAADDDNGNLLDGTPHGTAIHAAFDRHQIACATPAPSNGGCAGGPSTASLLTVTAQDQAAALTWTAVPGAARYFVYRADGVRGCAIGKARLGETAGTTFTDAGLVNGFAYHYTVLPVAANAACFGPMSACSSVVPAGAGLCTP